MRGLCRGFIYVKCKGKATLQVGLDHHTAQANKQVEARQINPDLFAEEEEEVEPFSKMKTYQLNLPATALISAK